MRYFLQAVPKSVQRSGRCWTISQSHSWLCSNHYSKLQGLYLQLFTYCYANSFFFCFLGCVCVCVCLPDLIVDFSLWLCCRIWGEHDHVPRWLNSLYMYNFHGLLSSFSCLMWWGLSTETPRCWWGGTDQSCTCSTCCCWWTSSWTLLQKCCASRMSFCWCYMCECNIFCPDNLKFWYAVLQELKKKEYSTLLLLLSICPLSQNWMFSSYFQFSAPNILYYFSSFIKQSLMHFCISVCRFYYTLYTFKDIFYFADGILKSKK